MFWFYISVLLFLIGNFYLKFRIGFDEEMFDNDGTKGWDEPIWRELVFDILLFFDIIVNFRTAYIKDIQIIDNWK